MASEYVRPLPCIMDEGGEAVGARPVKMQVLKVDEELNELKNEICRLMPDYFSPSDAEERRDDKEISYHLQRIADEAADVITAVTTLEQALGIDEAARDEAQRRVNRRNQERGRI